MLERYDYGRGRRLACAYVAVNRVCVEVDRVACFNLMGRLAVPDIERSREQIEKLATSVLMRTWYAALLQGQELRIVRIELPIRYMIAETLEEICRVIGSGLRQSHALVAAMHPEQRLRLRIEEVAQVFGKHHGYPRPIA